MLLLSERPPRFRGMWFFACHPQSLSGTSPVGAIPGQGFSQIMQANAPIGGSHLSVRVHVSELRCIEKGVKRWRLQWRQHRSCCLNSKTTMPRKKTFVAVRSPERHNTTTRCWRMAWRAEVSDVQRGRVTQNIRVPLAGRFVAAVLALARKVATPSRCLWQACDTFWFRSEHRDGCCRLGTNTSQSRLLDPGVARLRQPFTFYIHKLDLRLINFFFTFRVSSTRLKSRSNCS